MFNSIIQQRGQVAFPAFMAERVYMREFRKETGLPSDLTRWQPTVDAMLDGVDTDLPIFIMIDQGIIDPGSSHRRPGLHIDGYWHPKLRAHSGRHGGRSSLQGGWDVGNGWKHCDFSTPEALILASDITASRALSGIYLEAPGEGGDCTHVNVEGMSETILCANTVYAGNVSMIHESLPVTKACQRTLVRLSVPGWTPEA
uniref:Uncharacterized protein n=1 Tax=Serratia phage Kevin TaxID=3161161 RepID=A0AAU8L0G0_9CAUD